MIDRLFDEFPNFQSHTVTNLASFALTAFQKLFCLFRGARFDKPVLDAGHMHRGVE